MLSKIIHTCWISKSNTVPLHIQNNIELFKNYFPGFEIKVWKWSDILAEFGSVKYITDCYNAARYSSCVSVIKCFVLDKFGGIWIDANTQLNESILSVIPSTSFHLSNNYKFIYGAEKGSKMFTDIVKYISDGATFINEDQSLTYESVKQIIDFKFNDANLACSESCNNILNSSNTKMFIDSVEVPFENVEIKTVEEKQEATCVSKYISSLVSNQYQKSVEDIENTNVGNVLKKKKSFRIKICHQMKPLSIYVSLLQEFGKFTLFVKETPEQLQYSQLNI